MAKVAMYTEDLQNLIDGLNVLSSEFPEIARYAINKIAKRALVLAKENIIKGGSPPLSHSKYTAELTDKLRGGVTGTLLVESNKLVNSFRITANTVAMGEVYVSISSDVVYAAILEYGGHPMGAVQPSKSNPNAGEIPARPYLRPAIYEAIGEAMRSDLEARFSRACELCVKYKKMKKGKDYWKTAFKGFSL